KGNPILKLIKGVPWLFDSIVPDYQLGSTTCALYLSLKYHNLNPSYIHERLKLLASSYDLRVLLVLVDVKDPHHALKELGKICILADCTLILAFSYDEAARYLELYKSYEHKPADLIMEKNDSNYMNKLWKFFLLFKRINRTDVATLSSTFGSFKEIANASEESLSFCPGVGPTKVVQLQRWMDE
ncbi:hypothetical protein HELRODRAFT_63358, partial [Helobdella robusta]|uniref:DNA excision repair protein ERCC-1 n=1 Tax=Helobdella robusta TaxID=6412 RepID=T1FXE8_HELRO